MQIDKNFYDLIIVGGGPAGLSAAIYMARAKYRVLLLEKAGIGGQITITSEIVNYPGVERTSGKELTEQMRYQAEAFGAEFAIAEVLDMELTSEVKVIHTTKGIYRSLGVILATGANPRKLGFKGEREFQGRGVAYCATCDGALYKEKVVAVVGGGNTSLEDCLYLSNVAKKIYLIHRRDEFRGDEILVKRIKELKRQGKIELVLNSQVVEVLGDEKVSAIKVFNKITSNTKTLDVDALFVAIGRTPDTEIFGDLKRDDYGYIVVDENKKTSILGVFCGGDVSNTHLRQIVTACGDGATASLSINEYLTKY